MWKIIVASKNPVKIDATHRAFAAMFPNELFDIQGVDADSGVSAQPWGKEETLQGAWNRVAHAQNISPGADFYVAIESGTEKSGPTGATVINMIVVTDGRFKNESASPPFILPHKIAEYVRGGNELATAFDKILTEQGTRNQKGGVGFLTGDAVTRTDLYDQPLRLALIPWRHPDLFGIE